LSKTGIEPKSMMIIELLKLGYVGPMGFLFCPNLDRYNKLVIKSKYIFINIIHKQLWYTVLDLGE